MPDWKSLEQSVHDSVRRTLNVKWIQLNPIRHHRPERDDLLSLIVNVKRAKLKKFSLQKRTYCSNVVSKYTVKVNVAHMVGVLVQPIVICDF